MSRGLSSGFKSAAAAGNVFPALLGYFDFSGGEVRAWTGIGPLVWGGNTYTGLGDLVGVSPVQETSETRATGLQFTLSGIPSEMVARILGEGYRGRAAKLWLALFDSSDNLIADPALLFSGRMDQCKLDDTGETSVCTIVAESRLIDLQRPRERRRTDEDQKSLFSGDEGLEFIAGLQDRIVVWGSANAANGPAAPTGAGSGGYKASQD